MPKRKKTRDSEIFQYEDGSFYFRGYIAGKRIEKRLDALTFGEAKERKEAFVALIRSRGSDNHRVKTGPLLDLYLKHREEELSRGNIRERTLAEDKSIIEVHLRPAFGKYELLEAADSGLWDLFVSKRKKMDLANCRKVWTKFLGWAQKSKYIRSFPKFSIPHWERRERVALDPETVVKIFSALTPNIRDMCAIMYYTGMRPREVSSLTYDQIDIATGALLLRKANVKTKKARVVNFNEIVLGIIQRRKQDIGTAFVFPNARSNKKPMHYASHNKQWREAVAKTGIKQYVQPYDLRSTYETEAHLTPGLTDTQLEKHLGASLKVQRDVYVKIAAQRQKAMAEVIQNKALDSYLRDVNGGSDGGESEAEKTKEGTNV